MQAAIAETYLPAVERPMSDPEASNYQCSVARDTGPGMTAVWSRLSTDSMGADACASGFA